MTSAHARPCDISSAVKGAGAIKAHPVPHTPHTRAVRNRQPRNTRSSPVPATSAVGRSHQPSSHGGDDGRRCARRSAVAATAPKPSASCVTHMPQRRQLVAAAELPHERRVVAARDGARAAYRVLSREVPPIERRVAGGARPCVAFALIWLFCGISLQSIKLVVMHANCRSE